jgi:hypothetical protein
MKVIKEFKNNELVYDNLSSEQPVKSIYLVDEFIEVNFNDLINTQFSRGNVGSKIEEYMNYLHLGEYSKANNGGFINFYRLISSNGNEYVLFSGVNEVSNSHYIVTIHMVLIG